MKKLLKMMSGVLSAAVRRRGRETDKSSCPPQDLMPVWGVPPHHARRLDAAGCTLVETIRRGAGEEHHIASSLRSVRELLSDFCPDKAETEQDTLLWTLLQDACCGAEFEPDTLWGAFLVGPIPE